MLCSHFKPEGTVARLFGREDFPRFASSRKFTMLRQAWRVVGITILFFTCFPARGAAQKIPAQKPVAPPAGLQIVSSGNEPELRVDGVPFLSTPRSSIIFAFRPTCGS